MRRLCALPLAGKWLAGRSALLRGLPIARTIGRALRLVAHPGTVLVQLEKDLEQVFCWAVLQTRWVAGRGLCSCFALWGGLRRWGAAPPCCDLWWRAGLGVLLCCQIVGCAHVAVPAPDAAVSGVALTRERVRLPPDTVFEATLLDVTSPDVPPLVLGRQRREWAGNPPYAIQIPYPSARFVPKGRYEVRVTVTQEGRLLLASDERYPVPQDAAYRSVNVWLNGPIRQVATAATANASVPLALTHWRLVDIEDVPLSRLPQGDVEPYVVFQADEKRITGSGGCNRFLADYVVSGGRLHVSQLVSNITLCLANGGTETRFFEALSAVEAFVQQGNVLMLKGAEGQTLLRFEAQEAALR